MLYVCYFLVLCRGSFFSRHKALLAALFLDLYETLERQIAGLCSKFLKPHFVSRSHARRTPGGNTLLRMRRLDAYAL